MIKILEIANIFIANHTTINNEVIMRNQTYSQKILNILMTQEQSGKMPVFNRGIATQRFPKVRNVNRDYDTIHGIVMRTARRMKTESLLKRVGPGVFTLSARGRKVAS